MSPPIRDGSANSIGSIRLGDGTEISEIRTGAGDVLFSSSTFDGPDTGLLHNWDARELSDSSTLTDQAGDTDLSANGSPTLNSSGINGQQTVSLDGNSDHYTGSLSESQPIDVFLVMQKTEGGGGRFFGTSQTAGHPRFDYTDNQFGYTLDAGRSLSVDTESLDPEIYLTQIDVANSAIYISDKNSAVVSGDVGAVDFGGTFSLGAGFDGVIPLQSEMGQVAMFDSSVSGYTQSDVWDYLSDEWGITV